MPERLIQASSSGELSFSIVLKSALGWLLRANYVVGWLGVRVCDWVYKGRQGGSPYCVDMEGSTLADAL